MLASFGLIAQSASQLRIHCAAERRQDRPDAAQHTLVMLEGMHTRGRNHKCGDVIVFRVAATKCGKRVVLDTRCAVLLQMLVAGLARANASEHEEGSRVHERHDPDLHEQCLQHIVR